MAENTKIEWTDHTFNPWEGCQKVGPGCDHCYAETRNARFAGGQAINWGPGAPRRRTSVSNWNKPLIWNMHADAFMAEHGRRQRVFCASLADVFDNAVDREWRDDLATIILDTPNLDWLLLTKRIGNAGAMLGEMFLDGTPPNVRIGVTIVNQPEADRDIEKLLALGLPNFLSMEPLLGPVDLERARPGPDLDQEAGAKICPLWVIQSGIDWVIVGGESGPGARPMHPDWVRSLRDQCQASGVPFLFKQWGEWAPADPIPGTRFGDELRLGKVQHLHAPGNPEGFFRRGDAYVRNVGKKAAGRVLDGCTWDEFPDVISSSGSAAQETFA